MTLASVLLEHADEDDLPALLMIERRCFSHPWSARNFRDAIAERGRGFVLLLRALFEPCDPERGVVAYCAFRLVVGEMQIDNLAVHPDHQGRGFGRRLLELALNLGCRRGARTALLEVRQSNWRALRLYQSLGFETVSVRRDYYVQPREDALVLLKPRLDAGQPVSARDRS